VVNDDIVKDETQNYAKYAGQQELEFKNGGFPFQGELAREPILITTTLL